MGSRRWEQLFRSRKTESNIEPLSSSDGPLAYCRPAGKLKLTRIRMKEWMEYAAVWIILKGLGVLPRPMARSLAAGVTRIFYALLPGLKKTAEVNLGIAFPEWTDTQCERS